MIEMPIRSWILLIAAIVAGVAAAALPGCGADRENNNAGQGQGHHHDEVHSRATWTRACASQWNEDIIA